MDMKRIEAAAQAVEPSDIATSASHSSRLSFNIVNSPRNGKRIRLSGDLSSAVGITESAAMLPVQDEGVLMVAKKLPYKATRTVSLKSDSKGNAKISYSCEMVAVLTQVFDLSFTNHTSMSFGGNDITLDKLEDGTPVALIHIYNQYPDKDEASAQEQ